MIENLIYVDSKMGNSCCMRVWEIPAGWGTPQTRGIPEARKYPGNSHTGNLREGKVQSLMGGRKQEFPVEHPCIRFRLV